MILIERVSKKGLLEGYDCENNLCAKTCNKCFDFKPIAEFHKYSGKDSRRLDCVACFNIKWKELRKKYKKSHKKLLNTWRKENPDKVRLQGKRRKRTDKHRETARVYWSKNR